MSGKRKTAKSDRGRMARRLVYFCVAVLTVSASWAIWVKTRSPHTDLTDVLTVIGAAFGGELLRLCFKRVFAKPTDSEQEETE